MSNYKYTKPANRNAKIVSRFDRTGKLRTETKGRDADSFNAAATTDLRNNATKFFIDLPSGETLQLSGGGARSLYRVLSRHYNAVGKNVKYLDVLRREPHTLPAKRWETISIRALVKLALSPS